ncbi:hypothetical protein K402DRAFT_418459 [Aulographum hederae CBS 113979]|uniref:Cellular morphogenesis protein n=1 Tax=Aulographum hederae CBS 113979 TaxID=1176131 RepID=A0A6G1H9K4_9PEZI|nr:hypothetical protein K402DRAFT_418459 [Aulographum hederae CBS 113979]
MRAIASMLRSGVRPLTLTGLLAATSLFDFATAVSFTPAPSPNLDLSQLGRVALAGDFDALSIYEYEGQNRNSFSTNGSQSLLTQYPNGAFANLAMADAYILTMCPFTFSNGTFAGVVVGGNFTSLGGVEAQGIALFNPDNGQVTPLAGLSGKVAAVFCDGEANTLYVGGSFSGGNSTNAISWNGNWANMPFAGFNGPVTSITKAPNGNIIFGGSFDGLGNTTTPRKRDVQVIPLSSGQISATSSSTTQGFSDPKNIICKTSAQSGPGNSWLLSDGAQGSWTARFAFGFVPTKLRLYNTQQDGRGTRTFQFQELNNGGILELEYPDPATGILRTCEQWCPLPQNNGSAQDFRFTRPGVGMNSFRININGYYGSGGGLSGIELLQDDIYAYSINDFNEPVCDDVSTTGAHATSTGPWARTPSGQSNADYLSATLQGSPVDPASASVVFQPDIQQSGNYSISIYTPGCVPDNTCLTRGRVNITGTVSNGSPTSGPPISALLYETNNFDKYDQIYFGYVDASSDSFKPSITLSPAAGQNGPLTIVAQRVRFELLNSTGGLNGLFEFNPNEATIDTDFSKSRINTAGTELDSGAVVNVLQTVGDNLFVAGNFSTSDFANIFSIGGARATGLPGNGLNSQVQTVYLFNGTQLFLGGNFSNTRGNTTEGLNYVALFDTTNNAWHPLGAGVNGVVTDLVPVSLNLTGDQPEQCIALNGNFNQVLSFGNNPPFAVQGLAIWVPSRTNWLHNLDVASIALQGHLSTATDVNGFPPILAGSILSQALGVADAAGLTTSGPLALLQLPVRIQPTQVSSSSNLQKRAINNQNTTGAVTGLIYSENNLNITILGGHFTARASDGSEINNLVFVNGSNSDQVVGVGQELDESVFLALGTTGTMLFAGGTLSGEVEGNNVTGLIVYDLVRAAYGNQPPALQGPSVAVNAIAPRPSAADVYVGGSFDSAGSFECSSLCVYDTSRSQWNVPGSGLGGSVAAMAWTDNDHLVVAGNLTTNGTATSMIMYNVLDRSFTSMNGASNLPGPITTLSTANAEGSMFWVAGTDGSDTAYLQKYNGTAFIPVAGDALGQGTVIRGLQILTLSDDHDNSDLVPAGEALLVLGQLQLPNFGSAAAALFNGTAFNPFLLSSSSSSQDGVGSLSAAFVQNPNNFFKGGGRNMAAGFVVLIALAIALAITFIVVVLGVIAERIRRKREGYIPITHKMYDKHNNMSRIPPEHLFRDMGQGPSMGRL